MAIDQGNLENVLSVYQEHLQNYYEPEGIWWDNEKDKWEVVVNFKNNWNLDAENLSEMFSKSMPGPNSSMKLDISPHAQPYRALQALIEKGYQEEVKNLFINLYDESGSKDVYTRVDEYREKSDELIQKIDPDRPITETGYRQRLRAISTYLFLKYPEKYFVYKAKELRKFIRYVSTGYDIKGTGDSRDLKSAMPFWEELQGLLGQNISLMKKYSELISAENQEKPGAYFEDSNLHLLIQDLTFFYGKHEDLFVPKPILPKKVSYWWINADPKFWTFRDLKEGQTKEIGLQNENGENRHVFSYFSEVKPEDKVICYDATPIQQITALGSIEKESDGKQIVVKKDESLKNPVPLDYFKNDEELKNMENFTGQPGMLHVLKKEEYNHILSKIDSYKPQIQINPEPKPIIPKTGGYNRIYYGVPGSGKSYEINKILKKDHADNKERSVRTVFYPEYSYSDFVGQIVPVVVKKESGKGNDITYQFMPGPFTRALQLANAHPDKFCYLVIEEINRGNAAAILGDVFQLLDRLDAEEEDVTSGKKKVGESRYFITNDNIAEAVYGDKTREVTIPANLVILASMNTSDQNVFTLDNAFQRRWEMELIPNNFNGSSKHLDQFVPGSRVPWKSFATVVNECISKSQDNFISSEDKRLGVYFAKGNDLKEAPRFAEKVLRYLWEDAMKMKRKGFFKDGLLNFEDVAGKFTNGGLKAVFADNVYSQFDEIPEETQEQPSAEASPVETNPPAAGE